MTVIRRRKMDKLQENLTKIVVTLFIAFILSGVGVYYKMGKLETTLLSMKESQTKVLETEVVNLKESKKAQWAVISEMRDDITELKVEVGKLRK